MKRLGSLLRVGIAGILVVVSGGVGYADSSSPTLSFREVKITGDEFVVLQANQDVDLSDYWLGYNSSDTAGNIVPTQQLPAQPLRAGQAILLTSDGAATCDAVLISKLSFSLGDTKGTLALRQLQNSGNSSTFTTTDTVNWSKPSASGTTTDNLDLRKETGLNYPVWYHAGPATAWQAGDFANCTETIPASGSTPITTMTWPQNDTDPPAVIESLSDDGGGTSGPYLPAADVGLLPPQLTELLPNPAGTGTDGTDEFIELYNPNGASFDLSGFVLQTGLSTKHNYTFPTGTMLPPKAFVAFYSADTGLSLSNTNGQADLTDPFDTVIAQSEAYGSAKDGVAWALAKGTWYWTSKPTPNASNVVNQSGSGTSIKTTTAKKAAAAVKGASTTKSPLQAGATSTASDATAPAPIHTGVLVAVAVLAVGYGVYEYRHDFSNRLHQFREHRAARRKARG